MQSTLEQQYPQENILLSTLLVLTGLLVKESLLLRRKMLPILFTDGEIVGGTPGTEKPGTESASSTTATFHAEYVGTTVSTREHTLKHTACVDWFAGEGKPAIEAQNAAYPILNLLGGHMSASIFPGATCGSCVKLSANNRIFYVTVVDSGGNTFDLHPEIFFQLFGVDSSVQTPEAYWPTDEIRERYKGMGGVLPMTVEFANPRNCPGYPSDLYEKWTPTGSILPAGQTDGEIVGGTPGTEKPGTEPNNDSNHQNPSSGYIGRYSSGLSIFYIGTYSSALLLVGLILATFFY
eukprot:GHVL01002064.1.p1 GENE.GHVL01002064.1~~GHVL01002064.1.p1  ORF type:complete len:293 (-),score=29.02 GHVL01002064.1:628-1506(-)